MPLSSWYLCGEIGRSRRHIAEQGSPWQQVALGKKGRKMKLPEAESRLPRRIVLTHWNAGVFRSHMIPHLLPELVVYSLLYDEVLIREEDLLTNRRITSLLGDQLQFEIFSELLGAGLVKLLRLPTSLYPGGRRFDPEILPISARAEEHQERRTYKGKPWRATAREWALFRRLDRIVVDRERASRPHSKFPFDNPFATKLAAILENRQAYRLGQHPVFSHLDPQTADAFARFCREPEAWQRFLHKRGVKSPIVGPDAGFYRSAAYQCSAFLPTPRAIVRLAESVYAATYCEREESDGRYGGSELVELPLRFESGAAQDTASDLLIRAEVVPTVGSFAIGLVHGISEVLELTRASAAFESLQVVLSRLGSVSDQGLPSENSFRQAWSDLSDVYAENWARVMIHPSTWLERVIKFGAYIYVAGKMCGAIVLPEELGHLRLPQHWDEAAALVIEQYAPSLLAGVRGLGKIPRVRESVKRAAQVRCSKVPVDADDV